MLEPKLESKDPSVFRFREHRGSLDESLMTERSFKTNDRGELISHLQYLLKDYGVQVNTDAVLVEHYCKEERLAGWPETYIVTIAGYGVMGFTNYMPV